MNLLKWYKNYFLSSGMVGMSQTCQGAVEANESAINKQDVL